MKKNTQDKSITGVTSSGFEYKIKFSALNNFELLDAISEIDENPLKMPRVLALLLGDEQKKNLYNHVRNEAGEVPVDLIEKELLEIFTGDKVKN